MRSAVRYPWWGIRGRVLGLVVLLLIVLTGLVAALQTGVRRQEAAQKEADRTRTHMLAVQQVIGDVAEMKAALRGYLVTGQDRFLAPYFETRAGLFTRLTALGESVTDTRQRARLGRMVELVQDWEREVVHPEIALKRASSPEVGRRLSTGIGQDMLEAIKALGAEFATQEENAWREHVRDLRWAAGVAQWLFWSAAVLGGALALVGVGVFARGITRATDALVEGADAIARGEFGVAVHLPAGDGELARVAAAMTAMSRQLDAQREELQAQQEELAAQNELLLEAQADLSTHNSELEQQKARLVRLNELAEKLGSTIDLEAVAGIALEEYLDLFGAPVGALLVAEADSAHFRVRAQRGLDPALASTRLPRAGYLAQAAEGQSAVTARYPDAWMRLPVWNTELPVAAELYLPLTHLGETVAVAVLGTMDGSHDIPADARLIGRTVGRHAAVALNNAIGHRRVRQALEAVQEQAAQVEELNAMLEGERDQTAAQRDIYLSIVTNMRSGALLTNANGRVIVANAPFRQLFAAAAAGTPVAEVARAVAARLAPDSEDFAGAVDRLLADPDKEDGGTIRVTGEQAPLVLQWHAASVRSGDGIMGRLFTFQDITELYELDRMKSDFVHTVSHELRTPLTSVLGYVDMILGGVSGPVDPQQKELLQVVRRNTERLARLIGDLLDIERIESRRMDLQRREVNLADAVRQASETLAVTAREKGLKYEVSLPAVPLPSVWGDYDRLVQVAVNLIGNAVKYTPRGSVQVEVRAAGGGTELVVTDTGVGMAPEVQDRAFQKFVRGPESYVRQVSGTGLGLSIVKALVEAHEGTISIESAPGRGTRVRVAFPPARPTGAPRPVHSRA